MAARKQFPRPLLTPPALETRRTSTSRNCKSKSKENESPIKVDHDNHCILKTTLVLDRDVAKRCKPNGISLLAAGAILKGLTPPVLINIDTQRRLKWPIKVIEAVNVKSKTIQKEIEEALAKVNEVCCRLAAKNLIKSEKRSFDANVSDFDFKDFKDTRTKPQNSNTKRKALSDLNKQNYAYNSGFGSFPAVPASCCSTASTSSATTNISQATTLVTTNKFRVFEQDKSQIKRDLPQQHPVQIKSEVQEFEFVPKYCSTPKKPLIRPSKRPHTHNPSLAKQENQVGTSGYFINHTPLFESDLSPIKRSSTDYDGSSNRKENLTPESKVKTKTRGKRLTSKYHTKKIDFQFNGIDYFSCADADELLSNFHLADKTNDNCKNSTYENLMDCDVSSYISKLMDVSN